jgi:adenine specific DNA methylase Mod
MNKLYFGDNLDVLRERLKDESVDLVYLDPPFNSDANYNVLFKQAGQPSQAQAEAFRDTWAWGDGAGSAYDDIIRANGDVALIVSGLRKWLGESAMMAYLAMMAVRLLELRRIMKDGASIYLHCDPVASHYLKILMDAIFGAENFLNDVVWKRADTVKGNYGQGSKFFDRNTDDILFYAKHIDHSTFHHQFKPYSQKYIDTSYRHVEAGTGRRYQLISMTGPGGAAKGNPSYEVMGVLRYWRYSRQRMQELIDAGMVVQASPGAVPRRKQYLDEGKGVPLQSLWDDVPALHSQAKERMGYPTQKPIALLERIIKASSDEEMVVLDPFCGCGTSVEAAEKLKRQWIGIDVTHYAITLIERRLSNSGVLPDTYQVAGRPTDLAGARDLARRDKHQFQWWAAWRLGARWYREEKKGADRGIDGRMMFKNGPYGDGLIIISVKGGDNIGVQMVRDLRGVIEREEAEMGILVCLAEPTGPMKSEGAAAGFVSKSAHGRMPRLQVVTIADILEGRMPKMPPLPQPERIDRTAPRKQFKDQLELLLPFAGDKVGPAKGDFVDPSIMAIG